MSRYRPVIVLSIFLLIPVNYYLPSPSGHAYAQETGVSNQAKLEEGERLLNKGDFDKALSILLEAAAKDPDNPEVYNYLGEAYYRLKRLKEAAEALKRSIELKHDYITPHIGLAMVYEFTGDIEGAVGEYEEVVRIGRETPDTPEVKMARDRIERLSVQVHIRKGSVLLGQGRLKEALDETDMALSRDADNPYANLLSGLIYKQLGKAKESYGAFKKVVGIQPGNPIAHFHLGDLDLRFGSYKEAIDEFSEVLKLAPESREAREAESGIKTAEERLKMRGYFEEAAEAVKGERYEAAEEVLQRILKSEPDNAFALYNMGVVYYSTGRADTAIEYLKRALELNPRDVKAHYQLAVIYDHIGRLDEAITEYDKAGASGAEIEEVKKAKERVELLRKYVAVKKGAESVKVLLEGGDLEGALKEVEGLLAAEERNADAHLMLGRIQMRMGRMEKAIESAKRAVAIRHDYWEAYIFLGQVYESLKRYKEAAEVYRVVTSNVPKSKEGLQAAELLKGISIPVHFEQAKKYMEGGDLDGALKEITSILESAPDNPVALYNAGVLYDVLNRPGDAIAYLKRAIEANPEYVQAHLQLALVYQASKRFDEAEREFRAVLSLTPTGKEADIAKVKLGILREEEALSAHIRGVNSLMSKGDFVGAKNELETVIAISPENYMAYLLFGFILDRMGRYEDARDAFKRVVEIKPDYATGYLYLGQLYEKENHDSEARDAYRKASAFGAGTRDGEIADIRLRRLRKWRISGSMGHTLDSNISYKAKRQTGVSTGHSLNFSYNLYTTAEKGLTLSTSVNRSLSYQSQLAGMTFGGNLRWSHQFREQQSYGITTGYNYSLFEGSPTYQSYSFSGNTSLSPKTIPTSLSIGYSFSDTASFVNKASNANQHTLSLSLSQNLSLRDSASGSYSFSIYINKDPLGSNYASRTNTISMKYSRTIMPGLFANMGYSIGLVNYSNPDSTTLFNMFRRNISQTINTDISYQLSESVSFSVSVSSAHVTTNLPRPSSEELRRLEDVLSVPIPLVGGGYRKETVNMNVSVVF